MPRFAAKLFKFALVMGGVMLLARLAGPKLCTRMERMMEEAPEDFMPKWMRTNVGAIRDNTERIAEAA